MLGTGEDWGLETGDWGLATGGSVSSVSNGRSACFDSGVQIIAVTWSLVWFGVGVASMGARAGRKSGAWLGLGSATR